MIKSNPTNEAGGKSSEVSFSASDVKRFRRMYNETVYREKSSFWFKGNEYLTSYAGYLLEYFRLRRKRP